MRGLGQRVQVVAGAAVVLLVAMAGVASAAGTVKLGWTPPGTVSFGALAPGATSSPPQVFTLANTGTAATSALKITVVPASGTPASAFTKTADSCTGTSLGPQKSCTVKVTFTAPVTPGSYQAILAAASNKPAATASVTLTGATEKAAPAISTAQQPASATVGSLVADQASVSGGDSPAGTVTFTLYDNSSCTGPALFTDTEVLSGGSATSAGYTTTAAGTDYWQAAYNGDSHNNSVSSTCNGEPVVITPAIPSISTTPQPGSATVGSSVADQASVSDGFNPTGTVTFILYDNTGCSGTPLFTDTEPLVNGVATSAGYTATATGNPAVWLVAYNGDANNIRVSTGCGDEPVFIGPATPALTTSQQPASATVGTGVADQATVTGGFHPGGTVTFHLYDNSSCTGTALFTDTETLSGGSATSAAYTTTAVGTGYWRATYNGDANNNAVTTRCDGEPVTITPATPAITTSQQPASATVGTAVADQATVTGGFHPGGTVTFHLYDNPNCTSPALFTDTETLSGGSATSKGYTTTAVGTGYWQATYNGDASNNSVTTRCGGEPVTITPAITTSPSAGGPAGGTTVTDTAALSGGNNPTGTITFNLYGPSLSAGCSGPPIDTETVNVTGNGTYTTPAGATPAQAGTYWWTATYNGDANNPTVSSGCGGEQVDITGDLTISPGRFFRAQSPNENEYSFFSSAGPGTQTTQTFTVTNAGNTTSDTLDLRAPTSGQFSVSNENCSFVALDPGDTCTFDLTFTAPATGCPVFGFRDELDWIAETTGDIYLQLELVGNC